MDKDQLVSLRDKILEDVVPLVIDSAENGSDRFDLLLRVIRAGNANSDLYARAYDSAKAIEDNNDRLEALLSLLDEVDFDVNQFDQADTKIEQPQELSGENPN
jgi:hypothetical protein